MEQSQPLSPRVDTLNEFSDQAPMRIVKQITGEDPSILQHVNVPSMIEELESKFAVGQVMKSIEETYLLYCQYAHAKGFGVKKGDQRYFTGTTEIQAKEFECSCEGSKDEKCSNDRVPIYQKLITRTRCKARLRIGREKGGEWKVTRFVMEHNHEMVAVDQTHLLRSSRNISHAQKSTLEAMVNAGIPVAKVVSYMESEAQGSQFLEFTRKDAYDHIGRLRKSTKIENGDATELLQYFINKSNDEPLFFWNMQVDDDNRVMNFFFRDHQSRVDFEHFGDVLSVDTTYRTNRYNLICAPFVGINHHKQNVMFGLALMSDETESSFDWLFRTFLKSMGGKQPETIFTDQCQAMMNAIDKVFSFSHHRLCQWHINQNVPSHLGNLKNDGGLKYLWNKCMQYCESEEEFEVTWKKMIDDYKLDGNSWLKVMYNLRHRWSNAFSNNKFSAGLLATSRSEGTNSVLKKGGNKRISLCEFVLNYEKIQITWRENEKAEDTRCFYGRPATTLKNNPLLDHGADVYTLKVFNLFQVEMLEALNIQFTDQPSSFDHLPSIFKMKSYGQNSRVRVVVFDVQSKEIKCSCRKFESMGILCRHALRVFNFMNVQVLPKKYIKERWTKNMKNRVSSESSRNEGGDACPRPGENGDISELVFVNQKMRMIYDLLMRSKGHEETRNILSETLDTLGEQINSRLEDLALDDPIGNKDLIIGEDNNQTVGELVRNPLSIRSRGITNACIQRHWDKNKKGKKRGMAETSNMADKRKKRKEKNSQINGEQCPSQEFINASSTQEHVYLQPSHHLVGHPFYRPIFENQPCSRRFGGNVVNTLPSAPHFSQEFCNAQWNLNNTVSTPLGSSDTSGYRLRDFLHGRNDSRDNVNSN